ncbi:hypothetical protein [uncultured Sneathiella sp.]|uniref:hypothetical protein n=1 Tax=uncultured Sneathiella sp. TaxID=879315 RepID=UPI0030EB9A57
MRKTLIILLILCGLGLIGWVGYDYSASGEEVARFELAGEAGSTGLVRLDPSMNPMRAILSVSYDIELLAGSAAAFDYSILLTGPGGAALFEAEGQQRDKREDNAPEYASKTSEQVIKTFDVSAPGQYLIDWQISPKDAKIKSQTIFLRRNVEPLRVPFLIAGAVSFGLGFLLLVWRRKKPTFS